MSPAVELLVEDLSALESEIARNYRSIEPMMMAQYYLLENIDLIDNILGDTPLKEIPADADLRVYSGGDYYYGGASLTYLLSWARSPEPHVLMIDPGTIRRLRETIESANVAGSTFHAPTLRPLGPLVRAETELTWELSSERRQSALNPTKDQTKLRWPKSADALEQDLVLRTLLMDLRDLAQEIQKGGKMAMFTTRYYMYFNTEPIRERLTDTPEVPAWQWAQNPKAETISSVSADELSVLASVLRPLNNDEGTPSLRLSPAREFLEDAYETSAML